MKTAVRWVGVVVASSLAGSLGLFILMLLGEFLYKFMETRCTNGEFKVDYMFCYDTWYTIAGHVVSAVGVGLTMCLLIVTSMHLAPSHRIATSIVTYTAGVAFFALLGFDLVSILAAVLFGAIGLVCLGRSAIFRMAS